jgi:hypothetical protein
MRVTDVLLAAAALLAEEPRNTGPDFGKASPLGLLVVVLLMVATFGLVWSMNKQLKKLPESFDQEHPEPDQAVDDGTVGTPNDDSGSGDPDGVESGGPRRDPG